MYDLFPFLMEGCQIGFYVIFLLNLKQLLKKSIFKKIDKIKKKKKDGFWPWYDAYSHSLFWNYLKF